MLFTAFAAEFGISVIIWLAFATLTLSIAGAVALVKSEGAAAPPFAGFALGAFLAYYVVAIRHGFGDPALLRWAPIGPSLGFAIGMVALWPWPRVTGQAVAGCLLLLQGSDPRFAGIIALAMLASLFAGAVPATATVIILGTLAVSYWGRAAPWAEAQDKARSALQALEASREQRDAQIQTAVDWVGLLHSDPSCVLSLTENQDLDLWSEVFSEAAALPLLRSWEERFLMAMTRYVDDPAAVEQIGRAARMIRGAIARQGRLAVERNAPRRVQAPGVHHIP